MEHTNTKFLFVPMDLFGNDGTQAGCRTIYQAMKDMDPTINCKFYNFNSIEQIANWRESIGRILKKMLDDQSINKIGIFGGNHLTVLPIYDQIIQRQEQHEQWTIVRFDAHLDVEKNCTPLNIGNFMGPICRLLPIINLGSIVKKGYYTKEITDKEIGNNILSFEQLGKFFSGDSLFIDVDIDVLQRTSFKSYLSIHQGGISVKDCIELIKWAASFKKWQQIVFSVTEFCGLLESAPEDVMVVIDLASVAIGFKGD